ncbi:MAG: CoA transferase [Burkholderiaceae bacterium]|nr:CoA transferase [Burkholderiaceae bacterium]
MVALPLQGVRVLDFSWVLAGPYASRILGDFGAEIIKVQSARIANGTESNRGAWFDMWNRNKRSIALDMTHAEACDIAFRLAAGCDVLLENFSPRVMANWGLTYDRLREANPRLIMVSASAMGKTGPWRDYVAFGPALHALSGFACQVSEPDTNQPLDVGYAHGDHVVGLFAALAVLAALEARSASGRGRYVDLSGYEAMCTLTVPTLFDPGVDVAAGYPHDGNCEVPDAAPSGCYRCSGEESWCTISVSTESHWRGLCNAMGRADWFHRDTLFDLAGRRRNAAELDAAISRWTAVRAAGEVEALLQAAGVPAAKVRNARDLVEDPHLIARGFFRTVEHPLRGRLLAERSPVRFVHEPVDVWSAAPQLGADTRDVLRDLLGMDDAEIARLQESGVLA